MTRKPIGLDFGSQIISPVAAEKKSGWGVIMKWKRTFLVAVSSAVVGVAFALFGTVRSEADLITSISDGTLLGLPTVNLETSGPETVATGVTWSATTGNAAYGWTNGYGFVNNGFWSGSPAMVGTNDNSASMTFAFSTPVSAVGGILNWVLCPACIGGGQSSATIAVYNSTDTLIESYTLSNSAMSNLAIPNSFYGFSENTADISYFTLTGDAIGLRDLTDETVTPIPSSFPLFATGLAGLGLLGWRRKRKARSRDSLVA